MIVVLKRRFLSRKFRQKATERHSKNVFDNLLPFQDVAIFNSDSMIQIKQNAFCRSHVDEVVFLQTQK